MAHAALRVLEKLTNTPHLIHPQKFEIIYDYLKSRAEDDFKPETPAESDQTPSYEANNDLGIGVINIEGPLTYKPVTFMGMDCGGASYQAIKEDFTTLVDQGLKTIVLMIDSGGGEAYQCFDTAKYMRELADENDVRIISYVDGLAASAAYGLACIADEIVAPSDAELGSIGVLVKLINDSKALEQEGYERTFITAGKSKIPFDAEGNFREEFLKDLQEKVDDTYAEFTSHVSQMRSMDVQSVIDTEAKVFSAEKAQAVGLLDKIMTHEQFYKYLQDTTKPKSQGAPMLSKIKSLTKKEDKQEMSAQVLEELQGKLATLETEKLEAVQSLASVTEQLTSLQGVLGEKESLVASLKEQVASLEAEKVANKAAARKSALSAVVAQDQVDTIAASLESLDDKAFETVVAGFSAKQKAVSQSEMFQEAGSSQSAEVKKVDEESTTLKAIKKITSQ